MFDYKMNRIINEMRAGIKSEINIQVREICRNLVFELFNNKNIEETSYWGNGVFTVRTLYGELEKHLILDAQNKFLDMYEDRVEKYVASEAFIDSIIDRINKKQLSK